jgi:hypothetical protein
VDLVDISDLHVTIEDLAGEGDRVAAPELRANLSGGSWWASRHRHKYVQIGGISIFRLIGGKITEFWEQIYALAPMQQPGVVPRTGAKSTAGQDVSVPDIVDNQQERSTGEQLGKAVTAHLDGRERNRLTGEPSGQAFFWLGRRRLQGSIDSDDPVGEGGLHRRVACDRRWQDRLSGVAHADQADGAVRNHVVACRIQDVGPATYLDVAVYQTPGVLLLEDKDKLGLVTRVLAGLVPSLGG